MPNQTDSRAGINPPYLLGEALSVGAGFILARKGQPATSPSVVSTGLKNSGSNDSAESNGLPNRSTHVKSSVKRIMGISQFTDNIAACTKKIDVDKESRLRY